MNEICTPDAYTSPLRSSAFAFRCPRYSPIEHSIGNILDWWREYTGGMSAHGQEYIIDGNMNACG